MAATIHAPETLAFDDNLGFIEPLNSIVERGFAEMRAAGMLIKEQRAQGAALAQSPNKRNLRRQLRGFLQTIVSRPWRAGLCGRISTFGGSPRYDILRDSLRAVLSGILTRDGADALKDSPIFQ